MNYTTEFIEKVKATANIVEVASPYFPDLNKNVNAINYTATCEKCGGKISFSQQKNIFKCFTEDCESKGDIFSLLQSYGGMSFAEAVVYLAKKYRIPIAEKKKNGVTPFGKIETIKRNNNTFFPNSFQTPNAYVDELCYLLTPEEFKILVFIIRRILGFENKRELHQDNISVSQIQHGQQRNGSLLSHGVGLSRPTIMNCLNSMCRFRIIRKVGAATKRGQLIELNLDGDTFDWKSLHRRFKEKKAQDIISAAESAKSRKEGILTGKPRLPVNGKRRLPVNESLVNAVYRKRV